MAQKTSELKPSLRIRLPAARRHHQGKYLRRVRLHLHVYKRTATTARFSGTNSAAILWKVGTNVQGIAKGTRRTAVGFSPCGKRYWCKQGEMYRCSAMALLGLSVSRRGRDVHVPFAVLGRSVFPLPEEVNPHEDGASVEPLSISDSSVNWGHQKPNQTISPSSAWA